MQIDFEKMEFSGVSNNSSSCEDLCYCDSCDCDICDNCDLDSCDDPGCDSCDTCDNG